MYLPLQQCDHAGLDTDVEIIGTDEYIADDENIKPFKDKVGNVHLQIYLKHPLPAINN